MEINMTESINHFARLAAINVSEHIERKGGFAYLSWPYAVSQLRTADPTATWEVRRFNDLPYLATEAGVFVEVTVTVQGVTLSQIHPVLDGRNRPILAPTAFDINTSLQRCLVKAIALHGLGLYIYAGEDLPQPAGEAANDAGKPGAAAGKTLSRGQQAQVHKLAMEACVSLDRVCRYFGVDSLAQIAVADLPRVIRSLENRRAAA
ncbi:hypothetical protein ALISP_2519 [Alicycliphilus sp. B1]|nr:hypothetical protein ALISP_2519 [Alicycliphilus sp. B1]